MLDEATIQEHWNNCLLPLLIACCTIPKAGTNVFELHTFEHVPTEKINMINSIQL